SGTLGGELGEELPADFPFRGRGRKGYRRIIVPTENPTVTSGAEWKKWEGNLPAKFSPLMPPVIAVYQTHRFNVGNGYYRRIFPPVIPPVCLMDTFQLTEPHTPHSPHTCNHLRALTEPPSKPPLRRRRHSPSSSRPNLRSPAVVFSVTSSRGEGSIENDEDPQLGNGAVDPYPRR
ncbi:hypothetical protein PIB30_100016, partial [Stylosanthes scabra]|nr:hypothetical protein [Stylosanthes scabra]